MLNQLISQTLMKLGITPNTKGFHYIKYAIQLCPYTNTYHTTNLNKYIYPNISSHFNVSGTSVEKNIRYAIQQSWMYRDKRLANDIFKNALQSKNDIPSNSLYISTVVEWINAIG